jgi:2-keto-3-deoxy-L-rhamnonate aldolase RhmA
MPLTNILRNRLRSGDVLYSSIVTLSDPAAVEIAAAAGADLVGIDLEHTSLSLEHLVNHLRAARAHNIGTLVRPSSAGAVDILRVLDAGADGLLLPGIDSVESAAAALAAGRYPPLGTRGVSGASRSDVYGAHGYAGLHALTVAANEEVVLGLLIETAEAVRGIDKIVELPGIDLVQIGVNDLAASMGILDPPSHPEMGKAVDAVFAACRRKGIAIGMRVKAVSFPLTAPELRQRGVRLLVSSSDTGAMLAGVRAAIAQARAD